MLRPMMTEQLGYSILTAPIAAIDRRALSQAWYSALHVAREPAMQRPAARAPVREAARGPVSLRPDEQPRGRSVVPAARRGSEEHAPRALPQERRAERSPLACRIERTFLRTARRAPRATFTLEGTKSRVHVALQATPNGLRLVAICPQDVRTRVARALEQARYALALRGIALHCELREARR